MSRELLCEIDENMLCLDGFDEAIIGYVEQFGRPPIALYDKNKLLEIMIAEGMSELDATEFYEFNQIGAYVGEYTPAYAILFEG